MPQYVSYIRVSTERQSKSGKAQGTGLGLEAQRAAVARVIEQNKGELLAEYVEVESGKRCARRHRPQLSEALIHARRAGAVLVIAKIDRLARNVAFTTALMDSEVDLCICDLPGANRFTIHVIAAMAEEEARLISERTKQGLAVAKAHGTLLGSARPNHWKGRESRRRAGSLRGAAESATSKRRKLLADYGPEIVNSVLHLRVQGMSQEKIAAELSGRGVTARTGDPFNRRNVARILAAHEHVAKVDMASMRAAKVATGGRRTAA